jgi:hypothetical protein
MKIDKATLIKQSETQVSTPLGDETAILETRNGYYFSVAGVGSVIWDELKEAKTAEELCDTISTRFDVDRVECLNDVIGFLSELLELNLITAQS